MINNMDCVFKTLRISFETYNTSFIVACSVFQHFEHVLGPVEDQRDAALALFLALVFLLEHVSTAGVTTFRYAVLQADIGGVFMAVEEYLISLGVSSCQDGRTCIRSDTLGVIMWGDPFSVSAIFSLDEIQMSHYHRNIVEHYCKNVVLDRSRRVFRQLAEYFVADETYRHLDKGLNFFLCPIFNHLNVSLIHSF
jgi:hypothetical protein